MQLELVLSVDTGTVLKELLEELSNTGHWLLIEYRTSEGTKVLDVEPFGIVHTEDKTNVEAIVAIARGSIKILDVFSISIVRISRINETQAAEYKRMREYQERQEFVEGTDLSDIKFMSSNPLTAEDFLEEDQIRPKY